MTVHYLMAWIFWDPKIELFYIPIINRPIVWYGVFFALGFVLGYWILLSLLYRYMVKFPLLQKQDVNPTFINTLLNPKSEDQKYLAKMIFSHMPKGKLDEEGLLKTLNHLIVEKQISIDEIKDEKIRKKVLKYNGSFRVFLDTTFSKSIYTLRKKTLFFADKITVYMILSTVIGAKLFHLFFYERPEWYLKDPLHIIKFWEPGLASHGAAIGIIIGVILLSIRYSQFYPRIDWITLLDILAIPASLIGGLIRIGNFFNQEILGTKTTVFWAVIFGHPVDGSIPVPRHPVQLYEALFYFLLFGVLWKMKSFLFIKGRLIGIFLITLFSFRVLIEFLKEEQSELLSKGSWFSMGQYLSIPLILLGLFFLIKSFNSKELFSCFFQKKCR